jgi:chromosome segregation ATPase
MLVLSITCNVLAGEVETFTNLSAQLNAAHLDKANTLNAMSVAQEDGGPKIKELNLWDEQLKGLTPQVEAIAQKRKHHNEDAAMVNEKVSQHNAGCTGTLPRPTYERCKGEELHLQSEINRIKNGKAQLSSERDSLLKRVKDIEDRRSALSQSIQQLKAKYDSAKSNHDDAVRRIASITTRLKADCTKAKTPEGMAYCGQVEWDGARAGLTAPDLKPRSFTATPNR